MKVRIRSLIPTFKYAEDIDLSCNCSIESSDEIIAEILDFLRDELWDFYSNIFADCPSNPQGLFHEAEVYSQVCEYVREVISRNRTIWVVECSLLDTQGNILNSFQLEIADLLTDMLDSDSSTGEFDSRLSSYVEGCLIEYVKQGKWHVNKDLLWYGIDGASPIPAWSINPKTTMDELSIWFISDGYDFLKKIGDFSESFLTWYLFECGNWTPDMNEIRELCPIQFENTDSVDIILNKLGASSTVKN